MKYKNEIRKWIAYLLGLFLLGIAFNMIFLSNKYFSYGILSFGILANSLVKPAILMLVLNLFLYGANFFYIEKDKRGQELLSVIALPLMVYITSFIPNVFLDIDKIQMILVGGVFAGFGYGLINKYNLNADGLDLFTAELKKVNLQLSDYIINGINVGLLIVCFLTFGFEKTIYSTIIYFIISTISNRINIGVSDSKTFCIVTKKPKELKKYITDNLNQNVTVVDVEGGYTKTKKKMIMSVIRTREYYALKEKVQEIDNEAFITILDSYQVITKRSKK